MQWLKNKYLVMLSYLFDLTPYDYFSCSRIIKDKKKKEYQCYDNISII